MGVVGAVSVVVILFGESMIGGPVKEAMSMRPPVVLDLRVSKVN